MEIINVKVGSPSQSTNVDIENPSQVKAEIKNITINTGGSSKAVLYYPQELTSEQKQQARANIDAASQKDLQDGVNEALKEAKESGDFNGKDATVKIGTLSDLKELPELKIYQVTQEEYNDSYEAGTLDPNAVYVTPDSDIVDNLTTSDSTKVLSAKQGVAIKTLIDALQTAVDNIKVPTQLSELTGDATHRTVTDAEKETWNAKSNFDGNYNNLSNKPSIPSNTETWTFTLEDGSTVNKVVYVG